MVQPANNEGKKRTQRLIWRDFNRIALDGPTAWYGLPRATLWLNGLDVY